MSTSASIATRLVALMLVIGGVPLLDGLSGGGQAVIGFALCVVLGAAVGRWWVALVPFAVLAALAAVNVAGDRVEEGEMLAGAIALVMLGAFGATGALFGVALNKALRREPSTA